MNGLGRTQRQVILCLMDGNERSASRVAMDTMLTDSSAYGALRGLWKRGLVDRQFDYNEMVWHLTGKGLNVALELFPDETS